MKVSVLIPTLNEVRNIAACLESVRWADEVVVVDSGSRDGTVERARELGARVVPFDWKGRLPKKKNWALANVAWRNDWVLVLDADERVTPELAEEVQSELQRPRADGYFINRRFVFLGKWIRHCGYYPSWNMRLFRHRLGRYESVEVGDAGSGDNEVHEHVVLNGRCAHLKNDLLHFAYPDIYTWVEKHNRYSNWEARVELAGAGERERRIGARLTWRRRLRAWSRRLPFRPTLRFWYSYVWQRGFLDGRAGLTFCRLLAAYEMLIVYKAREGGRREKR
ncbi:MAG TPA: glycosyltransferase family 2 protein [Geobacteraceae bacterium]